MPAFGPKSEQRMRGLHPDLIRVLRRAIQSHDFSINEGVRTDEQCFINFGKGRTAAQCVKGGCPAKYAAPKEKQVTWLGHALSSNHRIKKSGFGEAVDLLPYPFTNWEDRKAWDALAAAMFAAAKIEKVKIRWGYDWDQDGITREKGETDGPHFELVH